MGALIERLGHAFLDGLAHAGNVYGLMRIRGLIHESIQVHAGLAGGECGHGVVVSGYNFQIVRKIVRTINMLLK